MFTSTLPFEVLGQVAPILTWAESDDGTKLPDGWTSQPVPFHVRERGWLIRELPTYSYDNIEDIIQGARRGHFRARPATLPSALERRDRVSSLSPPEDYDLLAAFGSLVHHFFVWNGTELCVREGTMEDLHELAIRLPAGHVLRHAHARAISEGIVSFDAALDLPELVTLLPSNSFGLRSVVRHGLSESHLHLSGVTSAEETWADNLLRPISALHGRGQTPAEQRLFMLNLLAGRLLAVAIWHSFSPITEDCQVRPSQLLRGLDTLYFARSETLERLTANRLAKEIRNAVYGDPLNRGARRKSDRGAKGDGLIDQAVPESYQFLLRWMAPTAYQLRILAGGRVLPSGTPEDAKERYRFVNRLHLAAHLRLVQLSAREDGRDHQHGRREERKREPPLPDPRRHFLHQALFRYMVCRTHFWQQATQQGRTTGLRRFREFWNADSRHIKGLTELQRAELTFDRLRQWRGLRVLEGRVSPPFGPHDLVPWILAHVRPEDRRLEKFGLVVHFKKEAEKIEERSFSLKIKKPVPRLRWGKRRRMVRAEGMRLYRLLRRPTPVSPFVVGIDAANLELATPPEVFAPVFRFLRELPIPIQGGTNRFAPFVGLEGEIRRLAERRRLGMTYHVGEDFRHLLSGQRAICEVVDFLRPNPGDRLGHGTALALDPKHWLEQSGYQAVLPKLEWLDTLVWVHHFLGPGDGLVGELAIEDTVQRLGWEIYSRSLADDYDPLSLDLPRDEPKGHKTPLRRGLMDWDWSPLTLWDAWTLRQLDPYTTDLRFLLAGQLRPTSLARGVSEEERRWRRIQTWAMDELRGQVGSRNAYLLLALYWLSNDVRDSGEETVVVDMRDQRRLWCELCERVGAKMKRLIHEKELVVEVNPSANRIIGPMARYDQHHVFGLTLDENKRLARQVRVSINTDNPAVCNTTLAHEYYLLGEILIRDGVPEAEVVEWLDWLRRNGNEYNFVRRLQTPEESPDMKRLMEWLRAIRPSVREARSRQNKLEELWRWHRATWLLGQGFSRQDIEAATPGSLEKIVALQREVSAARRRSSDRALGVTSVQLESGLQRLSEQLEQLKQDLGRGLVTPSGSE